MAAPKPQQLVFGDGREACTLELDQIACRTNALINAQNLPIFSLTGVAARTRWKSSDNTLDEDAGSAGDGEVERTIANCEFTFDFQCDADWS